MQTILELFRSSDLNRNIDTNPDTFLEQEVSGLRLKSAVELNNPLLYGNEAVRIANRTTKEVEDMKASFGNKFICKMRLSRILLLYRRNSYNYWLTRSATGGMCHLPNLTKKRALAIMVAFNTILVWGMT